MDKIDLLALCCADIGGPDIRGGRTGPDGRRRLYKGSSGGNSQTYYANLDALYAKQGEQLDRLMKIQDNVVIPGYSALNEEAKQSGSIANQERAAASASGAVTANAGLQRAATERQLTSMGVNPNDKRFVGMNRAADIQAAGTAGAADNAARINEQNMGFAKRKDVIGMGMGVPGQASEQMASMGNTISNQIQGKNQQQANNNSAIGNAVFGLGALMMKDGGLVRHRIPIIGHGYRYAKGGEKHLANGGPAGGFFTSSATPPPPPGGGQAPQGGGGGIMPAVMGIKAISNAKSNIARVGSTLDQTGGRLAQGMGIATGDAATANWGAARAGEAAAHLPGATQTAAPVSDAAITQLTGDQIAGQVAGSAAEDALVTAGTDAATTAGAEAAASAVPGMMGSVAAAVPWIAGGLALYSLADELFADGGAVGRKDMTDGGSVQGPGTTTSDSIPARLSDKEYVLNAEATEMVGVKNLDKINEEGLKVRAKMGKGTTVDGATGKVVDGEAHFDGGGLATLGAIGLGLGKLREFKEDLTDRQQRRDLMGIQAEQAKTGLEESKRQAEINKSRQDALKGLKDIDAGFLKGRNPADLTLDEAQNFRSMRSQYMAANNLMTPEQYNAHIQEAAHLSNEGAFKAIEAFYSTGGNQEAAASAFNRLGRSKIDPKSLKITQIPKGRDGLPDAVISAVGADGTSIEVPMSELAISNGVGTHYIQQRQQTLKNQQAQSEIGKNDAEAKAIPVRVQADVSRAATAREVAEQGKRQLVTGEDGTFVVDLGKGKQAPSVTSIGIKPKPNSDKQLSAVKEARAQLETGLGVTRDPMGQMMSQGGADMKLYNDVTAAMDGKIRAGSTASEAAAYGRKLHDAAVKLKASGAQDPVADAVARLDGKSPAMGNKNAKPSNYSDLWKK